MNKIVPMKNKKADKETISIIPARRRISSSTASTKALRKAGRPVSKDKKQHAANHKTDAPRRGKKSFTPQKRHFKLSSVGVSVISRYLGLEKKKVNSSSTAADFVAVH